MASTFTIQLNNLRLFGAHGLYAEEAQAGNEFAVNVSLLVKAPKTTVHSLDETINYAAVYNTVQQVFSVRRNLLETLAMEMAEELKMQFPAVKKITVQISKTNPPIASFTGSVSVTYKKSYRIKSAAED